MSNTELETLLKNNYGDEINIRRVTPFHDEDFEAADMVCMNDIIVCRTDTPLKTICDAIETIKEFRPTPY